MLLVARECLIFRNTDRFRDIYPSDDRIYAFVGRAFERFNETRDVKLLGWKIVDRPYTWTFVGKRGHDAAGAPSDVEQLAVTFELTVEDGALGAKVLSELAAFLAEDNNLEDFVTMGVDLPVLSAHQWCPGQETEAVLFGNRTQAGSLVGKDYLHARQPPLTGVGVNVVVVDQGLNSTALGARYIGGWQATDAFGAVIRNPGVAAVDGHGMMIARNVLDIAPDVRLFDCPLIPPSIEGLAPSLANLPAFLGHAWSAWLKMLNDIRIFEQLGRYVGPWIFVNAWSVYDRRTEPVRGDYSDNPNHFFTVKVNQAADNKIDVIFCAGNCGLHCADMRCGRNDRGPGQSIHGANAFGRVLALGAVRTDTVWLGYSSQGPGPPHLALDKPDLAAPSQFAEDNDGFAGNVGTSAAAAVAAGVVAALRQRWNASRISPDQLRQILKYSARKTEPTWNGQVGYGIIDGAAAYMRAAQQFP